MLERHEADCLLDDERDAEKETETVELEDADTFSVRDYQAGFWSPPN